MSLNDELRGFWKLADTSDAGPNGFTLTNNNTVTFVAGKIGDAARFAAASSQYLSRADHASLSFGNADFSISVWAKLASTGTTRPIVNKNSAEWRLGITSANKIIFQFPGGGSLTHSLALSASTWYHVVAWYDAAADLMWISVDNGTPESASDSVGPVDSTNDVRIGRLGTAYWDGDLDALGVWGRVLTSDERTALYNSGNGAEPPFATAYTATLTETLTASDSIVKGTGRALTESATITDSLTKGTVRTLAEAPTLGDAISRDIGRTVDDGAVLSDTVTRGLARTLSEDSTLSDEISRALAREVSEALGVEDAISRGIARAFVESYAATDGRLDAVARTLTETLGLSDTITVEIIRLFGRVARPRTELLTARRTTELRSGPRTTEIL